MINLPFHFSEVNEQKQSFADVLRNRCSEKFPKLYEKTPVLESLFSKKRLQDRYFPVKFAKFLKTPFFTELLRWLLLNEIRKAKKIYTSVTSYMPKK